MKHDLHSNQGIACDSPALTTGKPNNGKNRLRTFRLFMIVLSLCFARPLFELVRFTAHSEVFSYILLVPFISLYLVWVRRRELPVFAGQSSFVAAMPFLMGVVALGFYWLMRARGIDLQPNDALAITTFSYLCFVVGGSLLILGTNVMRSLVFPAALLIFMIPFPTVVTHGIEIFFQQASATASDLLFGLSGTPVFRQGTVFQLPGLVIRVAEECSGIRSSLVLFISSLLAGHLFLESPWRRTVLTLAVIPLGILRNAIRIFTISMLCIHVDPKAIMSPLHTHGGPIFFLMSLVPFFLILLFLRRSEQFHGSASRFSVSRNDPRQSD